MQKIVGGRGELVIVEGIDICPRAWRILHNVSLRTFERYKAKALAGVRSAPQDNFKKTKSRNATVQVVETLRSLLEVRADHMPHLSCTLRNGEKVALKVLPVGTEWKQLLATANEVRHPHACSSIYGIDVMVLMLYLGLPICTQRFAYG